MDKFLSKAEIRAYCIQRRKSIVNKAIFDKALCEKFLNSSIYKNCDTLLLYCPLEDEPDILSIAYKARLDGKRTFYPKCDKLNKNLNFYNVTSDKQLLTGSYGIKEPCSELDGLDQNEKNCVCVLPALAYDKNGYRIGYGGGYYDRFLSGFECIKTGLIYSEFIFNDLPHDGTDIKSDLIFTENEVITVEKN